MRSLTATEIPRIDYRPLPEFQATRNERAQKSFLFGRCGLNWKKMAFAAKTALIIIGVSIAFFMKLPMAMLGIGAYGVLDTLFFIFSQRQVDKQLIEESSEIKKQIEMLEDKKTRLTETTKQKKKEVNDLRSRKKALKRELDPSELAQMKRQHVIEYLTKWKGSKLLSDEAVSRCAKALQSERTSKK